MASDDPRLRIAQLEVMLAQYDAMMALYEQPAWKTYERAVAKSRQAALEALATVPPEDLKAAQAAVHIYSRLLDLSAPNPHMREKAVNELKGLREYARKMQDADLNPRTSGEPPQP